MPLVLRAVKGSDLTPIEADGNFTFLDGRITTIEGLPVGVTITNVTMSGYTMTITMSDSSVYTVQFPQPDFTQMWAGAWQASAPSYTAGANSVGAYPPSGLYGVRPEADRRRQNLSGSVGCRRLPGAGPHLREIRLRKLHRVDRRVRHGDRHGIAGHRDVGNRHADRQAFDGGDAPVEESEVSIGFVGCEV